MARPARHEASKMNKIESAMTLARAIICGDLQTTGDQ
jgi:hypothetical protein